MTYRYSGAFEDIGIPYESGYGLDLTDVFTGEKIGVKRDYFLPSVEAHGCRMFKGKMEMCIRDSCRPKALPGLPFTLKEKDGLFDDIQYLFPGKEPGQ